MLRQLCSHFKMCVAKPPFPMWAIGINLVPNGTKEARLRDISQEANVQTAPEAHPLEVPGLTTTDLTTPPMQLDFPERVRQIELLREEADRRAKAFSLDVSPIEDRRREILKSFIEDFRSRYAKDSFCKLDPDSKRMLKLVLLACPEYEWIKPQTPQCGFEAIQMLSRSLHDHDFRDKILQKHFRVRE